MNIYRPYRKPEHFNARAESETDFYLLAKNGKEKQKIGDKAQ